jgi:adenosine kinase
MARLMKRIAVTGSVAYDTIMLFPGRFSEHILPEKTHLINVSFLVERLDRRRGGTASNIAYTLALLGEHPLLCAAVGADFDADAQVLAAAGVDVSATLRCEDVPTASGFITTDMDDNQITAFHPGAMSRAAAIDLRIHAGVVDCVVVAPDSPDAMAVHVEQAVTMGSRLVFAPAQQLPSLSDATLTAGLHAAWLIVGNDYELELVRARTGLGVDDLRRRGAMVALTRGAQGSELHSDEGMVAIPAAPATLVDPTGAGDAYIAGLLAGIRRGLEPPVAGRVAALAAAYVVESSGTQEHRFTLDEFAARYERSFGAALLGLAGSPS